MLHILSKFALLGYSGNKRFMYTSFLVNINIFLSLRTYSTVNVVRSLFMRASSLQFGCTSVAILHVLWPECWQMTYSICSSWVHAPFISIHNLQFTLEHREPGHPSCWLKPHFVWQTQNVICSERETSCRYCWTKASPYVIAPATA